MLTNKPKTGLQPRIFQGRGGYFSRTERRRRQPSTSSEYKEDWKETKYQKSSKEDGNNDHM